MAKIARKYGKSRIWGEVFKSDKGSWINLRLGFQLGNVIFDIKKEKDGNLKLERVVRKKDGSTINIPVGFAFKHKTKNGKEVWKFTVGLVEEYSPEMKKNIVSTNDALFLTIITLDKDKQKTFKTKDGKEITKVGLVVGQLGIEVEVNEENVANTVIEEDTQEEIQDEDVPF